MKNLFIVCYFISVVFLYVMLTIYNDFKLIILTVGVNYRIQDISCFISLPIMFTVSYKVK